MSVHHKHRQMVGATPAPHSILARIRRDADDDGIPAPVATAIAWAPLIGAVLLAAAVLVRPVYYVLLDEDRVVEWLQFALCLAATGLATLYAVRRARAGQYAAAAVLLVGGLGLLGIAGEEISWGQRVLDFGTPNALLDVNKQNEFNFHNITTGLDVEAVFKLGQTLVAILAVVLALLVRTTPGRLSRWRDWAPPLFLVPGLGLLVAYRLFRYFVYSDSRAVVVHFQEWAELWLYLAIAVTVYLAYGRWRRASERSTAPAAALAWRDATVPVLLAGTSAVTLAFAMMSLL